MIHNITDIHDPRVAPYVNLTEAQLRNRLNPEQGLFIAESPKVIKVALDAGYEPVSLLCEERHIGGDAKEIIDRLTGIDIFTGDRKVLEAITGYTLTRGVLCAMKRKPHSSVEEIIKGARRVAVIDSVTDTTNIGAIFRSAAALGIDGIFLTPTSCDPLNRRSIRVSMGSVFLISWTWLSSDASELKQFGFKTVAMALKERSINIDDPILKSEEKVAMIMGTEGDGLSDKTIMEADYICRIPMSHNVDSLNVAAASAIAFWELCRK